MLSKSLAIFGNKLPNYTVEKEIPHERHSKGFNFALVSECTHIAKSVEIKNVCIPTAVFFSNSLCRK